MATDDELLIINTLTDNWNTSNATLPKFYYDDTIQQHDYRNYDAVKVYFVHREDSPKGIGYVSFKKVVRITIDVRSSNRERILKDIDEIIRIVQSKRKTLTGYTIFKNSDARKQSGYFNYYQYIIETTLIKYRTTI